MLNVGACFFGSDKPCWADDHSLACWIMTTNINLDIKFIVIMRAVHRLCIKFCVGVSITKLCSLFKDSLAFCVISKLSFVCFLARMRSFVLVRHNNWYFLNTTHKANVAWNRETMDRKDVWAGIKQRGKKAGRRRKG